MKIIEYNDEIVELSAIIAEWYEEYNGDDFNIEVDIPTFASSLQRLIDDEDCVLLAMMNDDKVVGIFGVEMFNNPLNGDKVANEHFWYVLHEYRGRGIKLIRSAIKWAKDNNCSHIMLNASMLASDLHDKTCMLYEKIGAKKIETSYIKEIKDELL